MRRALLGLTLTVAAAAHAGDLQLLRAGLGSGAGVKKAGVTGWRALFRDRLVAAKLLLEPVHHPIDDDGKPESVKSGVEVKVAGEPELPLVLIRGLAPRATLAPLLEGTAMPGLYEPGKPVTVGGATLETFKVGERGARLELRVGAVTQTLFEAAECDTDGWSLRWAGDLDGDGKLDLLLSADTHYSVETLRLFLSSKAKKGQLVREVAKVSTTGC